MDNAALLAPGIRARASSNQMRLSCRLRGWLTASGRVSWCGFRAFRGLGWCAGERLVSRPCGPLRGGLRPAWTPAVPLRWIQGPARKAEKSMRGARLVRGHAVPGP